MKKEKLIYESNGPTANIFSIIGNCQKILKKQNRPEEAKEVFTRVNNSQSYEEALEIIGEYVELIDE